MGVKYASPYPSHIFICHSIFCSQTSNWSCSTAAFQCWCFSFTSNSNAGLLWAGTGKQAFKPNSGEDLFLWLPFFFLQLTVSGFGGFLIGSLQCFLFWLSSCPSNMTPMPPISPSLSIFVYQSLYRPSLFISDLLKCLRSRGDTLNKNPMVGMVII